MPEWLSRSLQEHSVLWLLLSGVIGVVLKFAFDNVLAARLSDARDAAKAIRKYRYPLLRAADTLDRRLENFIRHPGPLWYTDRSDQYYRISTLYLFGSYFAWARILERAAYVDYLTSSSARRFSMHFYRTFKGLTSYFYFPEAKNDSFVDTQGAVVNRLVLTAIGDLLVVEKPPADPTVMDFVSFADLVDSDERFKRWFGDLDGFLKRVVAAPGSMHWNRLLIFATALRVLVDYLDTGSSQTSRRSVQYLARMRGDVAARLREELVQSGHGDLLPEYRKYGRMRRELVAGYLRIKASYATWRTKQARSRPPRK